MAAQHGILKGIITYQNSGKPVQGVNVSAFGVKPVSTDSSGIFELKFVNKKPTDMVDIIVYKKGLEVVSREKLRVAVGTNPDEPVRIVMRREGEGERLKKQHAQIAERAIRETYEKQLAKKDKTIAELTRQRKAALAQVKHLSTTFADVDLAQAPELYKKAFGLFKEGKTDAAIVVLDDAKIDKAVRLVNKAEGKTKKIIRQSAANYILKAQLFITKLQFKRAENYFQKAIDIDPGNSKNIGRFAIFYHKQNQFKKALPLYEKKLSLSKNKIERSISLNSLGNLYSDTSRFREAEKAYIEALNIRRESVKKNKPAYLPYVATSLNNLGALYYKTKRFKSAEKVYIEALNIRRESAKRNKSAYLPKVATSLNNLGILYKKTSRFKSAEKVYIEALNIRRESAKKNKAAYLPDVATSLNNLGALYYKTSRLKEAERVYIEALSIRRELAIKNKAAYLPNVATSLNNLGALYYKTKRFREAAAAYIEALNIRRQLAKKNKAAYLPNVATSLNNLGNLYLDTKRFNEAETVFIEALNIRKELAKKNITAYLPGVAMILNNLGVLYKRTSRFKDAEKIYVETLKIRRQLARRNRAAYLPDVATSLNNLGLFYRQTKKFPDALKALNEAREIREMLARKNPRAYEIDLCRTLITLSMLYIKAPGEASLRSMRGNVRQYLDRAISILAKYPHVPLARRLLKLAKNLKSKLK
jgi:tetratricopeptide (TPR) repeat protein